MFADMIRNSNTEYEIYLLLNSYIEAVRFCDKLNCCVSERITRLPLSGIADVRKRFEQLMLELDMASKRLDDHSCAVIKEGMHIFCCAVNRLGALNRQHHRLQDMTAAGWNAQLAQAARDDLLSSASISLAK